MDNKMDRYIVNHTAFGYSPLDFNDREAYENVVDAIVAVIVDHTVDDQLSKYYKAIDTLLKNDNWIVLISVNDNNTSFKSLASLVISRNGYDIYLLEEIETKETITGNYIADIEKRNPDITEVKSYIGGDIIAYNNLDNIMIGIETLVHNGDMEGLARFIEQRSDSIESIVEALNILKKKSDAFDSQELFDMVNSLREENDSLEVELDNQRRDMEKLLFEKEGLSLKVKDMTSEVNNLKKQIAELQSNSGYGSSVIKSFKEVNTQLINCKARIVLYFKEISYVSHCNTLVSMIQNYIDKSGLKTKLLIYDTQTALYKTYAPLTIVTGKDYIANKDTILTKNKQVVIAEPVPTIIQDVLMYDQVFDVVIIYDRIKGASDIVTGNNVVKFYIVNSSKDYREVKNELNISDTRFVITRAESSITDDKTKTRNFIDIPTIKGFDTQTESAKMSKYFKLKSTVTGVDIIKTIISMARIDKLRS